MHRYVNALIWQCAIAEPHIFNRQDSVLPLSRYISQCTSENRLYYQACGVELQAQEFVNLNWDQLVCHLDEQLTICIMYFSYDIQCEVMIAEIRDRNIDECCYTVDDTQFSCHWHWNGKIYRLIDSPQICDAECMHKKCKRNFDEFFRSFQRFRKIRIRKS